MSERRIDPPKDARDARFLDWLLEHGVPANASADKMVWDAAWQAALDWSYKDGGR